MKSDIIYQIYLKDMKTTFAKYKAMGEKTFVQLSEDDFHFILDEDSNSISIIVQHISGNLISRFTDFLTSDGEKPNRNRDSEFEEQQLSKTELIERWNNAWKILLNVVINLKNEDLLKTIYIRKEPLLVLEALNRSLTHTAYHVGQIVFLAKHLKKNDWKTLSIPKKKK